MNKIEIEKIKQILEDLLKARNKILDELFIVNDIFRNYNIEENKLQQIQFIEDYDIPLIKLNNILEKEEQFQEILEIEKEMKKLQSKRYINVKEFTEIYGFSSDWQKNRRSRIHYPLPFIQTSHSGKITYEVSVVEMWFENNNISR